MYKSKVIFKLALPICALIGAVFISLTLYKVTARSRYFLTTSSPKGTYTVHLTGQENRPRFPIIYHQVRFSASKNSKVFLSDKYFHSGDWFDPSFGILYPQHAWVADNVLHFYRQEFFNTNMAEGILVFNKSDKVIDYLKVTSVDSFLLFNIQPGAITELAVSPSRGDSRWINVVGEFSEGQCVKEHGVGFLLPEERNEPFSYYIYITEGDSNIESPLLEKYKGTK